MRRLHVLWILYRQLLPVTSATSLFMWSLAGFPLLESDQFSAFLVAFVWLRSFCQILIWYLFRYFNEKGFVFYHHFGLSEIQLACIIYLLDLLIFASWIILISLIVG
jgi:hypothetical protein